MHNIECRKIFSLNSKMKKKIFCTIQDSKHIIYNIDYLNEILPKIKKLDEIDILKLLNIENVNQYMKCVFIPANVAWVSVSDNGKMRYFTKGHFTYGLDIIDLLCIYFNCKYSQLLNYLYELGFNLFEENEEDIKKHMDNNKCIDFLIKTNSLISNFIKDKVSIYKSLNKFAVKNSLINSRYEGENIFFVSLRYLKQKFNLSYSISTINKIINLYTSVGLIYKVPENYIQNEIYQAYASDENKVNIGFYSIPSLHKVKDIVISFINNLNKANIKYYDISKKNNRELSKNDLISVQYNKNKGGGDKTKIAKKNRLIKNEIIEKFNDMKNKQELIAKEWLYDESYELSQSSFNKIWRELVKANESLGKSVKPNRNIVKKYNLLSNQEVFIIKI